MPEFEISRLAMAALRSTPVQSADINRRGDEIATVWRDYEYALSKMSDRDPEAKGLALSLAQLAQEERHKRPFWKRIF